MIGTIGFKDLRIVCILGIEDEERVKEQEIFVDFRVTTDFSNSADSDHLEDTIDYVTLAEICTRLAKENQFQLLEKYAAEVLEAVLDNSNILEASIKVRKPKGLASAAYSFVELSRKRT
ncbi:MAG: Dihydroneopterin aldolase [Chlamydiae bacterium]|nr:Dihydroneopterin aldolase [Chlamydiota bacterium]